MELVEYLPEYEEWKESQESEVGKVKCDLCSYEWIAVRPLNTDRLECPNCENMVMYENN